MAEKRTRADKAQRQADQLEKKSNRRPAQMARKKKAERVTESAEPGEQVS
jgi:hypothetical protein